MVEGAVIRNLLAAAALTTRHPSVAVRADTMASTAVIECVPAVFRVVVPHLRR